MKNKTKEITYLGEFSPTKKPIASVAEAAKSFATFFRGEIVSLSD